MYWQINNDRHKLLKRETVSCPWHTDSEPQNEELNWLHSHAMTTIFTYSGDQPACSKLTLKHAKPRSTTWTVVQYHHHRHHWIRWRTIDPELPNLPVSAFIPFIVVEQKANDGFQYQKRDQERIARKDDLSLSSFFGASTYNSLLIVTVYSTQFSTARGQYRYPFIGQIVHWRGWLVVCLFIL